MKEPLKFQGIPSGDFECFCWEVDYETYKRIKKEVPGRFSKTVDCRGDYPDKDEYGFKNCGLYRLYPDDLMNYFGCKGRSEGSEEFYTFIFGVED